MVSLLLVQATVNYIAKCVSQNGLNQSIFPKRPFTPGKREPAECTYHPGCVTGDSPSEARTGAQNVDQCLQPTQQVSVGSSEEQGKSPPVREKPLSVARSGEMVFSHLCPLLIVCVGIE